MSLKHSGPSAVTTVDDVWQNYTDVKADFYIDGRDDKIVEIQPAQDGSGGYELVDECGQVIFVNAEELIWLTNPDRDDGEQ